MEYELYNYCDPEYKLMFLYLHFKMPPPDTKMMVKFMLII